MHEINIRIDLSPDTVHVLPKGLRRHVLRLPTIYTGCGSVESGVIACCWTTARLGGVPQSWRAKVSGSATLGRSLPAR